MILKTLKRPNDSPMSSDCVPIDYTKICPVTTTVVKFELWTDRWQTSMVNHQEGSKGSKDTVLVQSLYSNDSFTCYHWQTGLQGCRFLSFFKFPTNKKVVLWSQNMYSDQQQIFKPLTTKVNTTGQTDMHHSPRHRKTSTLPQQC